MSYLLFYCWFGQKGSWEDREIDLNRFNWKQLGMNAGIPLVILIALIFLPYYGEWADYGITLFSSFLVYAILSVSWALFTGTTGYLSLATAAFYGIGFYAAAIFYPATGTILPLIVILVIAAAVSFVLAFIVGAITLRLKGIYFAMFTFGLVLLMYQVVNYWLITLEGIRGIVVATESTGTIYYYLLGIFVVTMLVSYLIRKSKWGLALQSIGENEEAAAHTGVNVTMVKILVFAISAALMGMVGVIVATKTSYVDANTAFYPMISFSPALMAIFGGMGNLYGPAIGAVIFTYTQEMLQTGSLKNYYMLIFGVILIVTILYLPTGLIGLIQNLWKRIKGVKRASTRG
jgi:branched-chain amino acid transport system permease protein